MLIHLSSWPEIDARLNAGQPLSKTVVVPIGSNEQHGPTGLLGTDWLASGKLPMALGLWWLVLPMLGIALWLYLSDGRLPVRRRVARAAARSGS